MPPNVFSIRGSPVTRRDDAPTSNLGFEFGELGEVTTPPGWEFRGDTPGVITDEVASGSDYGSTRSYGSPHPTHPITDDPMGSWSVVKTYAIPTDQQILSCEAIARVSGTIPDNPSYANTESFYGTDDAFVAVRAYTDGGSELSLTAAQSASTTTLTQLHERTGRTGEIPNEWQPLSHDLQLPADTRFVEIELVATDGGDSVASLDTRAGDAGVLFDDARFEYPSGLVQAGGVQKDIAKQADLHDRYTDSEARTAVDGANIDIAGTADNALNLGGTAAQFYALEADVHDRYTDSEARSAVHSRYTDSEARTAVDGANVDIGGTAFDASNLGGTPASRYPRSDTSEIIDGTWDFQGGLQKSGSNVLSRNDEPGLNVDKVDGDDASDFASAGHSHPQLHDRYADNEARSAVDGSSVSVGNADDLGNVAAKKLFGLTTITLPKARDEFQDIESAKAVLTDPGGYKFDVLYVDLRDASDASQAPSGSALRVTEDSGNVLLKTDYDESPQTGSIDNPVVGSTSSTLRFELTDGGAGKNVAGTVRLTMYPN